VTITGPGIIDDLVADAAEAGHQITVRLIRDWTKPGCWTGHNDAQRAEDADPTRPCTRRTSESSC
jgi:hypothetical protein